MFNSAFPAKSRNLDNLDDVLIVRKITASDYLPMEEDYEEEEVFEPDKEQNLLAEEREILRQKHLQLFEADERGRQALMAEIKSIKERQEERGRALRLRQHALDIEKERAKKIAMLPPPLPASVKLLLRKNSHEPEPQKPEVQMPDELRVFHVKRCSTENKENVLSPEELHAQQRMQEEWHKKAQERYNAAIKKDRQREEYSKVMKEIQNAELLNRREIAKSIVSENKSIPCPLADKFQMAQKQGDIETAAEKIFKKMDSKEHAIEDIEGYYDSYAEVFERMDSGFESKMIDCVPSFLKENYEYLLKDDSKFEGGKNFTGLDDSSDLLNKAFLESSPHYDRLSGSEKLEEAIVHLDQLRSNIQTEYEQTLRPLLISQEEAPKKDTSDKAVEAKIPKMPGEDKAVGTEMSVQSPPPLRISHFLNSGMMTLKRRHERPRLGPFSQMVVPPMRQRDVQYPGGPTCPDPCSWSSSSYCSLPQQHGIPSTPSSGSAKCDICIAEEEKELSKCTQKEADKVSENAQNDKAKSDESTSSRERNKLSEYVQLLAAKYLAPRSYSESQSDSVISLKSLAQSVNEAFEREVVPKFREVSVTQYTTHHHPMNAVDKPVTVTMTGGEIPASSSTEVSDDRDPLNERQKEICDKRKESDIAESPNEVPESDEENPIGFSRQILGRRIPHFTLDSSSPKRTVDKQQQAAPDTLSQGPVSAEPYVFHELTTIHEEDSALTVESLHASRSKLSNASAASNEDEKAADRNLESSRDKFKMTSLLDPPGPDVTDLAKSIHFVGETQKEPPPIASLKTQDSANVLLKKGSSVPSSLLSGPSVSNDSFRSTSRQFQKSSRLPHFLDSRDIHQKDSNSEMNGLSSLTPGLFSSKSSSFTLSGLSTPSMKSTGNTGLLTSGLFSSDLSSPVSLTGLSTPSMKSTDSLQAGNTNSPVFTTYQSSLYATGRKPGTSTLVISPVSSSIHLTPTPVESKSSENEDQLSLLKSCSLVGLGNSGAHDSKKSQSMTPHFDISGPSSVRGRGDEIQTTTLQSVISGAVSISPEYQSKISHFDFPSRSGARASPEFPSNNSEETRESGNAKFQPMTPLSDFPSSSVESESPKFQPMTRQTRISALNEFQPMTPLSNFPSSNDWSAGEKYHSTFEKKDTLQGKPFIQRKKEMASSSSSESFAPLTPHSSISTPSHGNTVSPNFQGHTENFRALTPTLSSSRAAVTHESTPSGGSNFFPVKVRIDVLSDSASSKASSSDSMNSLPHLSYRFNVKVPDDRQHAKSIAEFEHAPRIPLTSSLEEQTLSKPEARLCAKVCSSGYFTPEIVFAEKQEGKWRRHVNEKDRETELMPDPSSSAAVIGSNFQKGSKKTAREAQNVKDVEEKMKASSYSKNLWGKAEARALNKPFNPLQLMSPASSSTENLSEISGSKVLYQSTPIKMAEEIAQEPGILEEPDLTLLTTTVQQEETLNTNVPLEELKTPTFIATISMLSFLQHELSCEKEDSANAENIKLTPVAPKNNTGSKGSQIPKYRERTKRLWNNLEEVKKKKELEERTKQREKSRLKAREYAKKLTPKGK